MPHQHDHTGNNQRGSRNLIPWIFLGIILFFLLTEHRAHFFGILPYLLLLACPLLHIFHGHGGHGGHGRRQNNDDGDIEHRHQGGCHGGTIHEEGSKDEEDKP